jgi:hypothetical protein
MGIKASFQPDNHDAEMHGEYCIVLRDEGWMIERQGQLYGPYPSRQNAVNEAIYATYGLQAGFDTD